METGAWMDYGNALRDRPGYTTYLEASNALDRLGPEGTGMPPLRIALLRNCTVEPLLPVIKGEAALAGFHPILYLGGYDAIAAEVLDPASPLFQFAPDLVLVIHWLESWDPSLVRRFLSRTAAETRAETGRLVETWCSLLQAFRRGSPAPILWNNFPLPAQPTLGILDAQSETSQTQTVLHLNAEIRRLALQVPDTYVVDFMSLLARLGQAQGLDERQWQASRVPLGRQALVPAGRIYGRFLRALRGRSQKCLVLDCDNTLWGGVVAEDGAAQLALGKEYPGRCFTAFQQQILDYHDRGVLLALCSKNNEADVLAVLRHHSEMLIREHHLATWQINWDDKVTNLRRIAADLNIGLDSLVFVDDNPFECGLVRAGLPDVATIQLPRDPSAFVAHLLDGGNFDTLTLSAEDRARTRMYREEGERRKLREGAGTLEEYLHSLNLVAEIGRIDDGLVPRVSQLTQKTNQFNLTTRRYAEGEVRALANSPVHAVLSLKLGDRIADLGTVGVAILAFHGAEAAIDTFLLSCRALGRGAEDALLAAVLSVAQARGCTRIRGRYVPTPKNQQVADFFARRGFWQVAADSAVREWQLTLGSEPYPPPAWIQVNLGAGERGIRHAG